MFPHIKTSKANREIITKLTQRLNLGAENIIARIALGYSLFKERKLNLKDVLDSGGKEYAKEVLLGKYADYYLGMIALHYNLHISDPDIPKYLKMHLDDGLELLSADFHNSNHLDAFDYLTDKIATGISVLNA